MKSYIVTCDFNSTAGTKFYRCGENIDVEFYYYTIKKTSAINVEHDYYYYYESLFCYREKKRDEEEGKDRRGMKRKARTEEG